MAIVQHDKSIGIKISDALLRIIVSMLVYDGFRNLVPESIINCVSVWGESIRSRT